MSQSFYNKSAPSVYIRDSQMASSSAVLPSVINDKINSNIQQYLNTQATVTKPNAYVIDLSNSKLAEYCKSLRGIKIHIESFGETVGSIHSIAIEFTDPVYYKELNGLEPENRMYVLRSSKTNSMFGDAYNTSLANLIVAMLYRDVNTNDNSETGNLFAAGAATTTIEEYFDGFETMSVLDFTIGFLMKSRFNLLTVNDGIKAYASTVSEVIKMPYINCYKMTRGVFSRIGMQSRGNNVCDMAFVAGDNTVRAGSGMMPFTTNSHFKGSRLEEFLTTGLIGDGRSQIFRLANHDDSTNTTPRIWYQIGDGTVIIPGILDTSYGIDGIPSEELSSVMLHLVYDLRQRVADHSMRADDIAFAKAKPKPVSRHGRLYSIGCFDNPLIDRQSLFQTGLTVMGLYGSLLVMLGGSMGMRSPESSYLAKLHKEDDFSVRTSDDFFDKFDETELCAYAMLMAKSLSTVPEGKTTETDKDGNTIVSVASIIGDIASIVEATSKSVEYFLKHTRQSMRQNIILASSATIDAFNRRIAHLMGYASDSVSQNHLRDHVMSSINAQAGNQEAQAVDLASLRAYVNSMGGENGVSNITHPMVERMEMRDQKLYVVLKEPVYPSMVQINGEIFVENEEGTVLTDMSIHAFTLSFRSTFSTFPTVQAYRDTIFSKTARHSNIDSSGSVCLGDISNIASSTGNRSIPTLDDFIRMIRMCNLDSAYNRSRDFIFQRPEEIASNYDALRAVDSIPGMTKMANTASMDALKAMLAGIED